jgi:Tat protein translocase TatB subunit
MGFSGIGIWEIVLIFVVIIIVLGPHRLPEIARTLGKWFRVIRKAGSDFTYSINKELEESKNEPAATKKTSDTKQTPPVEDKPASPGEGQQRTNE